MAKLTTRTARTQLPNSRTGIQGLDEVTDGGFPKSRPILICGRADLPRPVRNQSSAGGPK